MAWTDLLSTNFAIADTAVGAAGTTTGSNGTLTDIRGNVFSISTNRLKLQPDSVDTSTYLRDAGLRPLGEAAATQRVLLTIPAPWSTGNYFSAMLHYQSATYWYMVTVSPTYIKVYKNTSGSISTLQTTTFATPLDTTRSYVFEAVAVFSSGSSTIICGSVADAIMGRVIDVAAVADGLANLQPAGRSGVTAWSLATSPTLPSYISGLTVSNDDGTGTKSTQGVASGPASSSVGTISTLFTIGGNGTYIVEPIKITPSDGGAGGSFSPTYVCLSTSVTSATFSYTPVSTGAKTISFAMSNSSLTAPTSLPFTGTAGVTIGSISAIGTGGVTANLSAGAALGGTAPYTYQWYRSITSGVTPVVGNILSGQTALSIADSGLSPGQTYYYIIVATDATLATGQSAQFAYAASFIAPVISLTSLVGQTVVLSATAASAGTAPYTYQWNKLPSPTLAITINSQIPGATSQTLTDGTLSWGQNYVYVLTTKDAALLTTQSTFNVKASRSQNNINLLFIGDSITYGQGTTNISLYAPGIIASQLLPTLLGGNLSITSVQQGVPGSTVVGWVPGGGNYNTAIAAATAAFIPGNAAYAHIMLGTNDANANGAGQSGVSKSLYKSGMKSLINGLLGAGYAGVFLSFSPFVAYRAGYTAQQVADRDNQMLDYQNAIMELCNNRTIILCDTFDYTYGQNHTGEYFDGVHPDNTHSTSMGWLWATGMWRFFYPLFRSAKQFKS